MQARAEAKAQKAMDKMLKEGKYGNVKEEWALDPSKKEKIRQDLVGQLYRQELFKEEHDGMHRGGARLAEELTTEGRTYRIWVASVRYGDGTLHECQTEPDGPINLNEVYNIQSLANVNQDGLDKISEIDLYEAI